MALISKGRVASRLQFREVPLSGSMESFADSVSRGLSLPQKTLQPRFFYDEEGSKLFEQIMLLPEYYLTRCEQALLEQHASSIVSSISGEFLMVEFGSGNSCKTRLLIEASIKKQGHLTYVPIDISSDFLRTSANSLIRDYPELSVEALGAEYFDAISNLPDHSIPRLILFMGSNIGNFERPEAVRFLAKLARSMKRADYVLLGADQVKDPAIIEAAYNDPSGVTAQFNKNILTRINRELRGGFDLSRFEHHAPWIAEKSRIEMRLVSKAAQSVSVDSLGKSFKFEEGEYIHTESSHKYTPESLSALLGEAGLEITESWFDSQRWFGMFLLRKVGGSEVWMSE